MIIIYFYVKKGGIKSTVCELFLFTNVRFQNFTLFCFSSILLRSIWIPYWTIYQVSPKEQNRFQGHHRKSILGKTTYFVGFINGAIINQKVLKINRGKNMSNMALWKFQYTVTANWKQWNILHSTFNPFWCFVLLVIQII